MSSRQARNWHPYTLHFETRYTPDGKKRTGNLDWNLAISQLVYVRCGRTNYVLEVLMAEVDLQALEGSAMWNIVPDRIDPHLGMIYS